MKAPLSRFEVRAERDVALTRQFARTIAARLGFDSQDQARIVAAVSEVARNTLLHAGVGHVEFRLEEEPAQSLVIRVVDNVPGASEAPSLIDNPSGPKGDATRNLDGARGMMDVFEVDSSPGGGTAVAMAKALPPRMPPVTHSDAAIVVEELARLDPTGPFDEIQRQDRELIRALDELRAREAELAKVNRELERAGRGIRALGLELDERADMLKEAAEIKTRFYSNMSHELRTPLSSILGLARLLLDKVDGDLSAEQERQVSFILLAAHDLNSMVNDLLDLARIEAGREVVSIAEVDLPGLFESLRAMLDPLRPAGSPVVFVFDEPEALPAISTDEAKLSQVLQNFLSNALKFTERGEVRLKAERGPGESVVFSVSDTGIGIEPGHLESIFEEFGQVDGPLQRLVKGSGLGLPLVRKLAQLLGGRLDVRSQPGVGSTFALTIPIRHPDGAEIAPDGSSPASPP